MRVGFGGQLSAVSFQLRFPGAFFSVLTADC
jgi:hypothetical protein